MFDDLLTISHWRQNLNETFCIEGSIIMEPTVEPRPYRMQNNRERGQSGLHQHKSRMPEWNQRERDGSAVLLNLSNRGSTSETETHHFKSFQKELCFSPLLYGVNFLWASLSLGSPLGMQSWDEETSSLISSDIFNEDIHFIYITPETFHLRFNLKWICKRKRKRDEIYKAVLQSVCSAVTYPQANLSTLLD